MRMPRLAAIAFMATVAITGPVLADGLLAQIKQKGEVTVATEAQFPPSNS
ncbi:MAG: hypothetical protein AB7S41_05595 [Parvibaculaceae bacterium]